MPISQNNGPPQLDIYYGSDERVPRCGGEKEGFGSSASGVLPDYALIQQFRKHVPCVDVRVDDKLPDLS